MRQHILNSFALTNLRNTDFSYRLLESDLFRPEGLEGMYNKQVQQVAQKVASALKAPALPLHQKGKLFIAVPANKVVDSFKVDIAPHSISIIPQSEVFQIPQNIHSAEHKRLMQRFIDFEIDRQLSQNSSLWKMKANQFFRKLPIPFDTDSRIEIFEGFNYKLIQLQDGNFYITVDVTHKYIDKEFLSEQVNASNLASRGSVFKGSKLLNQNGDNWYTIELMGFGKAISQQEFTRDDETYNLQEYILSRTKGHSWSTQNRLRPDDLSIIYKYPNRNMDPHYGAASLARMIYYPSSPEVRGLHRFSIMDPSTRFDQVHDVIEEFFQKLSYKGRPISVSQSGKMETMKCFPLPALLFNKGQQLNITSTDAAGNTKEKEYGYARKQLVINNGILNKTTFDNQYLIVPTFLNKKLVLAIQTNIESFIKKLAPSFPGFQIVRYTANFHKAATHQVEEIEQILRNQNISDGYALFLLPDTAIRSDRMVSTFHDCLKSKLFPQLKIQCASSYRLENFFHSIPKNGGDSEYGVPESLRQKFRPYVHNLVFEHLVINRKWLYALAENLHYDVYVGIDVHNRYAGFSFFFKNGQHIFFTSKEVPKKNRSQRAEKLKGSLLKEVLHEKLKDYIPLYAPNPNGIVIIRDGRSFSEEEKALQAVIQSLQEEKIVESGIRSGVIDLHKQSVIPFRLAALTNGHQRLENPSAGAYRMTNSKEGFLFNTGFPFSNPGTAKPLHFSLQSGNVDMVKVLEDVFRQSMLAFSAPDRGNSLPITIKLIDTMLEPLSATTDTLADAEEMEESVTEY